MTNTIPHYLQVLFERLEADHCYKDNGDVAPITTIEGENGRFIPMYRSDNHFHGFPKDWRQGGGDYVFMTREGAQKFLDDYSAWFLAYCNE